MIGLEETAQSGGGQLVDRGSWCEGPITCFFARPAHHDQRFDFSPPNTTQGRDPEDNWNIFATITLTSDYASGDAGFVDLLQGLRDGFYKEKGDYN